MTDSRAGLADGGGRRPGVSVPPPTLPGMSETATVGVVSGPRIDLPMPIIGSLSPSRAADFKSCPLLYRYRSIDRLPQEPSPAAVRGTLVHSVLERLFDLPAGLRTPHAAQALLLPQWDDLRKEHPEVDTMFDDPAALAGWLASAERLIETYFELEDPSRVQPHSREELVEVLLADGLMLRGIIDRLDIAPTGEIRVVDYKTGASPRDAFEGRALFQMRFYALVIWRLHGVVPRELRLIYLGDRETLTFTPDQDDLTRFERTLRALWAAIAAATDAKDFQPNPSRLCDWCAHQALCPAFGGTPPPFPDPAQPTAPEASPGSAGRPHRLQVGDVDTGQGGPHRHPRLRAHLGGDRDGEHHATGGQTGGGAGG